MRRLVLLTWVGVLASVPAASARTWRVPSEVPKIYAAVDSAAYGDTVLVAPGWYFRERGKMLPSGEVIWIEMKDGVSLVSEGGPDVTTLEETSPAFRNTVILCDSVVDARISGFKFTVFDWGLSAQLQPTNHAMTLVSSDVVVENNVILHFTFGIEIYVESPHDGTPIIRGNDVRYGYNGITVVGVFRSHTPVIEGNTLRDCEYGIWNRDSNAYIVGNTIVGNSKAGVYFDGYSQSMMKSNRIIGNGKYGVEDRTAYVYQSPCLNCCWTKETANDVWGNGLYDVYFVEETGLGLFSARYNYWGTLCPQPSQFYGRVDVLVWVDSTHTVVCIDCENCHHSTEPTTWSSIKAMFR